MECTTISNRIYSSTFIGEMWRPTYFYLLPFIWVTLFSYGRLHSDPICTPFSQGNVNVCNERTFHVPRSFRDFSPINSARRASCERRESKTSCFDGEWSTVLRAPLCICQSYAHLPENFPTDRTSSNSKLLEPSSSIVNQKVRLLFDTLIYLFLLHTCLPVNKNKHARYTKKQSILIVIGWCPRVPRAVRTLPYTYISWWPKCKQKRSLKLDDLSRFMAVLNE